ncbi:MAG: phosphoglycerate mutase [Gemmatimonadetes bacterium]|nr:phosphoglycerate mutase [Gemmatimonadota bacterium]
MKVYLIRHGETDWNRRGLYQGTTDVSLNDAGRVQARVLAEVLAGVRFDAAYTSPLRRARETAEAVMAGRGVQLGVLPELREISYGLWQGRGMVPAGRCDAGLEWRWKHDPWSVRFPGGETLADVRRRAGPVLDGIAAAHPAETVLVSGHGHLNRVLLIHALRLPERDFWRIEQANAACWVLELMPGRAPAGSLLAVEEKAR